MDINNSSSVMNSVTRLHFTVGGVFSKVASYYEVTLRKETNMPKRKAAGDNEHEPLQKLLTILASPWTLLLLHRLHMEGPKRFGELKRRLGSISTKTLTERLRMLESEGWISRHYEPVVPPQVTYAITAKVLELDGVMIELDRIAERWYGKKRKEN
jgi:DNA-binding HxlR family transcriptional regulator